MALHVSIDVNAIVTLAFFLIELQSHHKLVLILLNHLYIYSVFLGNIPHRQSIAHGKDLFVLAFWPTTCWWWLRKTLCSRAALVFCVMLFKSPFAFVSQLSIWIYFVEIRWLLSLCNCARICHCKMTNISITIRWLLCEIQTCIYSIQTHTKTYMTAPWTLLRREHPLFKTNQQNILFCKKTIEILKNNKNDTRQWSFWTA